MTTSRLQQLVVGLAREETELSNSRKDDTAQERVFQSSEGEEI